MFVLAHLSDVHLAPLPVPNPVELFSKRGLGYLNWLRKRRGIHRAEMLASDRRRSQGADARPHRGDRRPRQSVARQANSRRHAPGSKRSAARTTSRSVPGNHDGYVRAAASFAAQHWGEYMRGDDDGELSRSCAGAGRWR